MQRTLDKCGALPEAVTINGFYLPENVMIGQLKICIIDDFFVTDAETAPHLEKRSLCIFEHVGRLVECKIGVLGVDFDIDYMVSEPGFTPEQMQKMLSMINDKPSERIHANMTGLKKGDSPSSESGGLYLFDMNNSSFIGGIPLRFWSNCVLTIVYLIKRLPSSVLNGKYPFELVYKRKPNLSYLRCGKTREVDHLQLFDGQFPQNPYDDGKDSLVKDGSLPHFVNTDSTQGRSQNSRHSAT
nr:ribonuclease H-like domain-containing protein [Tanacetum cinerariifolium]